MSKLTLKDEDGVIQSALRLVGFDVNAINTERMLHVVDAVRKSEGNIGMKDLMELNVDVSKMIIEKQQEIQAIKEDKEKEKESEVKEPKVIG